jgi:hypothetical protein
VEQQQLLLPKLGCAMQQGSAGQLQALGLAVQKHVVADSMYAEDAVHDGAENLRRIRPQTLVAGGEVERTPAQPNHQQMAQKHILIK